MIIINSLWLSSRQAEKYRLLMLNYREACPYASRLAVIKLCYTKINRKRQSMGMRLLTSKNGYSYMKNHKMQFQVTSGLKIGI